MTEIGSMSVCTFVGVCTGSTHTTGSTLHTHPQMMENAQTVHSSVPKQCLFSPFNRVLEVCETACSMFPS